MNRFLKINSPWLGLLALALFIVALTILIRPTPPAYTLSAEKALKLISDPTLALSPENLNGKELIDIRSADLYAMGHAAKAVNIPIRQILEKESIEYLQQLQKSGKAVVLYGSTELQAVAPCILLQLVGYSNIYRLRGSISATGQLIGSGKLLAEESAVDLTAFQTTLADPGTTPAAGDTKKPETVKPVKKETTRGGGC